MRRRALLVTGLALAASSLGAGAAARGLQAPATERSLVGTWSLDPYVSDHPEQIARALRFAEPEKADTGRDREGGGRGARERAGREPRGPSISDADRKALSELTEGVRFPPLTLVISRSDDTVTLNSGAGAPDVLHVDGKRERRELTVGAVERTATWDERQLVVAYTVGSAVTLTFTYAVAPTTGQLVVRVDLAPQPGAEPPPLEIKLVYDRAT